MTYNHKLDSVLKNRNAHLNQNQLRILNKYIEKLILLQIKKKFQVRCLNFLEGNNTKKAAQFNKINKQT